MKWFGKIGRRIRAAIHRTFRALFRLSRRWPENVRSLVVSLLLGLAVMTLIAVMRDSPWVQHAENVGLDWVFARYRGSAPIRPDTAVPFAFFEIDEKSFRAWGEPLYTPRDKLASMIRYARNNGAAVVVVDVALEIAANDVMDLALRQELENFALLGSPSHLVLLRGVRRAEDDAQTLPERKTAFIDDIVMRSHGHIHLATAAISLGDDGKVRNSSAWEPVCRNDLPTPQVQALPSAPLLVAALLNDRLSSLDAALGRLLPTSCNAAMPRAPAVRWVVSKDVFVNLDATRRASRIFYTIPWQLRPQEARPTVKLGAESVPLLIRIPAERIVSQPALAEDLHGYVVVIGASHADSRDLYMTPLGEMPGALILINAMHTLLQVGELRPLNLWLSAVIQIAFIIVMSLTFQRWNSFLGAAAVLAVIVLGIMPLSLWGLRSGMWLDFVAPLLAVQVFQIVKTVQGGLDSKATEVRKRRRIQRRTK
jgi:CHASE2 domain-containing sensor protein